MEVRQRGAIVITVSSQLIDYVISIGYRPIVLIPPGLAVAGMIAAIGQVYPLDLGDAREIEDFTRRALLPLGPAAVFASSDFDAQGTLVSGVLGVDHVTHEMASPPRNGEAQHSSTSDGQAPSLFSDDGKRKRVLLIHRHAYSWLVHNGECLAPVEECDIYLVTHPYLGIEHADPALFPRVAVANFNNDDELLRVCSWIIETYRIDTVVALHDEMLLIASELRLRHHLSGMTRDQVMRYRDKVQMKQDVARANALPVPEFAPLDDVGSLDSIDWSRGPRVIKPRAGLGSKGVRMVSTLKDARQVCSELDLVPGAYMIEEYIDAPMLHCDSLIQRGRPVFVSVAEYINRCGDFGVGRALGSIFSADEQLCEEVREINERVIAALPMSEGSTHLELFLAADHKYFFCEIACRPPGGGIDLMIRRGYDISLIDSHIRVEAGLPVALPRDGAASKMPLGSLGFYPDVKLHAGIAQEHFKDFGILEVRTYATAGDRRGGVRSATDYTHLYLLTGNTETALRSAISALPAAFKMT